MRKLALFAIGLIFGGGIGFVYASGLGVKIEGHDHGDAVQHAEMDHTKIDHSAIGHGDKTHDTPIDVDANSAPTLKIAVTADPTSGHNLHVMVKNFAFTPENASLDPVVGKGHAHVYVNGIKQGRLYGAWMHLDALPKGEVTVEVSLNSNNHQPFALNGELIKSIVTLSVE